jgi:cell division protein ZapB
MRAKRGAIMVHSILALSADKDYSGAMKILDQLEQRVAALLARTESLVKENASLKEAQARDLDALVEENQALKEALDRERAKNADALKRVEALVGHIREQTDQV